MTSADRRAALRQRLTSGHAVLQPLTFPQRELFECSPVEVSDCANHICCLIHVRSVIELSTCIEAVRRVVDRQEAMRTGLMPGKAQPLQMIRRAGEAAVHYRELSGAQDSEAGIDDLAREVFLTPFDLLQAPLLRTALFRRSADAHILVLAVHHAVADGWSLGVFMQDLCRAYLQAAMGLCERLPPVPLTYAAWGAAERDFWRLSELDKRIPFWRTDLADSRHRWRNLEGSQTATGPHDRLVTRVPVETTEAAQGLARGAGATLYSTLLTVFQVAYHRWVGETDVVVGTPVANRAMASMRETMGYCAGVMPVRVRLDPADSFSATLRATYRKTLECGAHAMPFAELASALGDAGRPGHTPLYEVRFALQNHPMPDVSLPGLVARLAIRSTGTARFHLGCEVTPSQGGLEVVWLFRPALFPKAEIETLARIFNAVLMAACRTPEARLADMKLDGDFIAEIDRV